MSRERVDGRIGHQAADVTAVVGGVLILAG
jgi:hypothetical protein